MSGKIADVYAEVNWKFDQVKLREVAKYIGDLSLASVISATSLTGLGLAIKDLIEQTGQLAVGLATIHSTTGIDTTFLQKFENASYELNSTKTSADALVNSLSKIKAGLNSPGGKVPFGLIRLGFTKEDFQGTLEDNLRMIWTRLGKTKPPEGASQAAKEAWQGLLNEYASTFGVSAEQFMAMSNPAMGAKYEASPYLNESELKNNIDAMTAWKTSVVDLNSDLERLVTTLTPALQKITEALDKFTQGTNKALSTSPAQSKDMEKKIQDYIMGGYLKDLDIKGLLSPIKLKKDIPGGSPVTINMPSVTIIANNVAEIEKWFETNWKKMMVKAANQFGLGST